MAEVSDLVKDFNGIRLWLGFDPDCGGCYRRSRQGGAFLVLDDGLETTYYKRPHLAGFG